jgi:hypothetical protein
VLLSFLAAGVAGSVPDCCLSLLGVLKRSPLSLDGVPLLL